MNQKSVRDMGGFEKWIHSLTVRSTIGVQILALAVGIIVLLAGFLLYYLGILYEYEVNTSKMAKAEAVMLDLEKTRVKADEILEIYDSIPAEEKTDGLSEDNQKKLDQTIDRSFQDIQRRLRIMKEKVGLRNAFVAAIDEKTGRMIYMVDSDPAPETFCHPGTWDTYATEEMHVLVHGKEPNFLKKKIGLTDRHQATITNIRPWGPRCTGGSTLYTTDKYTVMVCLDEKLDAMNDISRVFLLQYLILLLFVLFIVGLIAVLLIRRVMVNPINHLAGAAHRYSEDKQSNNTVSDHFRNLKIRKGNEIEELNLTMADMEDSLNEYVENLTAITAERERITTELELAARIQASVLPNSFPAFPERDDFDVHAVMTPAREVGGDFYDFFLIDEDHLAIMIADVAGKGIPAALFMMISKIMLDNKIKEETSPAKTLEQVNNIISKNEQEMFVTVWIGVLELSTGRIIAANAGHEKPIIIHPDGSAEMLRDIHGFVVGGMEGMKYKDYELQIEPGEKLLLYTDGVPEATAADQEMFGTDRILEVVNGLNTASPAETLAVVRKAVDDFVGEAEQFDDLTMLCVKYMGQEEGELNK